MVDDARIMEIKSPPLVGEWADRFKCDGIRMARSNTIRRLWDGSHPYRVKIGLLALAVFVLDTATDVDIPVLYVNVVLLATRYGGPSDVVAAGLGSVALTIISFLLTLDIHRITATQFFNLPLGIFAIVCVMILCLRNMRSQAEIQRARDTIALVSRSTSMKTMSASVVHEVTQPLAAIGANAGAADRWLALSPPNLEETRAATRRIVAEVQRASHIIDRLRRLMAPNDFAVRPCHVLRLVEEALEHMRLEIDDAGIDVAFVCPPDLTIAADGILIGQVIINALSNSIDALRAAEPGRRSIAIEARISPRLAHIVIKDTGGGVDEAILPRIFDPFFTTKTGKGMGIGLAVSQSIVETHGGTIRAFPNTPKGLVLEIALPPASPKQQ